MTTFFEPASIADLSVSVPGADPAWHNYKRHDFRYPKTIRIYLGMYVKILKESLKCKKNLEQLTNQTPLYKRFAVDASAKTRLSPSIALVQFPLLALLVFRFCCSGF